MKYIVVLFAVINLISSQNQLQNPLFEPTTYTPQQCSRHVHCNVGECCRSSDGNVILSTFQFYPEIDWWRNQVNVFPGNCTTERAKEGEKCDVFCICGEGLLCAPHVLCRQCGNICMSTDVINKLVQYYDSGCNCISTIQKPIVPIYPIHPREKRSNKRQKPTINIVNGVVKFPGDY